MSVNPQQYSLLTFSPVVWLLYMCVYVNATLEIPQNSRATCIVFVFSKTRLDKHETSCCVHIVYCAISQQPAATYRNVPQRAACHTVEERAHYANVNIALEINSNNWPKQRGISHSGVKLRLKHVETRHSVCKFSIPDHKRLLMYAWKCLVVSRLSGQLQFLNNFSVIYLYGRPYSLPLLRLNLNPVARTFS